MSISDNKSRETHGKVNARLINGNIAISQPFVWYPVESMLIQMRCMLETQVFWASY
jgi:hypothetical protein